MYRSPMLCIVACFLVLIAVPAAVAGQSQTQLPPGAPSQPQNPATGQTLPEQAPTNTQPPLATPMPPAPSAQAPGASMPSNVPGGSNSTLPPAPKSPVEPGATTTETNEPPPQPKTEILDTSETSGGLATDGHDPILDPPPFPKGQTTLVGGVIKHIDHVRNHLTLAVFGGGQWTVNFDERTHIFLKGIESTQVVLKKGERVYVDTMLDNNHHDIFARNIRLGVISAPVDAAGQIVEVNDKQRQVAFRDAIGNQTVRFTLAPDALIRNGSRPASFQDLRNGTLVKVKFAPERADRGIAREIEILATPGASFTFYGVVTFLDTHRGIIAIRTPADNKTYDLRFDPVQLDPERRLAVGAQVQAVATFEGSRYTAKQITVSKPAGEQSK